MNSRRALHASLICAFCLAAAPGQGQQGPFVKRFTAPQVVSGSGLTSEIVLLNTATTGCDFGIIATRGAGRVPSGVSIGEQTGGIATGTIPPLSSRIFPIDSRDPFVGAAAVDLLTPGCFSAFSVQLQFRLRNQDGGLTELFSYPSPEPLKSGNCAEVPVDPDIDPEDGDTNTPGFASLSVDPVDNGEIRHTLRDSRGEQVGPTVRTTTDGRHQSQDITQVFGEEFPGGDISTWRVCVSGESQGQPARYDILFIDVVQEGPVLQFDSNEHQVQSENCAPDPETLCLNDGRFQVQVDFKESPTGPLQQAQVSTIGEDDAGYFWFIEPENAELIVKMIDGCPLNDRFWVFYSGTTNVEYTIRVLDTEENETKAFTNPLGEVSEAITDTQAFATCP